MGCALCILLASNIVRLFFRDTELSTTRIAVAEDYVLGSADLSDFQGDCGELTFRGQGELDGVLFSPLPGQPSLWLCASVS
jgi:hypothetical protein